MTTTQRNEMLLTTRHADLSGLQKAAVLMLAIGEERATSLFGHMEDAELKQLSEAMANLGDVPEDTVAALVGEFSSQLAGEIKSIRPADATQAYLMNSLTPEKVDAIVAPKPRTLDIWDTLNDIQPDMLAAFLRNEHPQTAAVVLSRLSPQQAARIVAEMPDEFASEVLNRMLDSTSVRPEVLEGLEQTLRAEFVDVREEPAGPSRHRMVAEILDNLDGKAKSGLLAVLEGQDQAAATEVRSHMFRFENLVDLSDAQLQTLLQQTEPDTLALALKGCGEDVRMAFLRNLPKRQRALVDELTAHLGPVRLREIDDAQGQIVSTTRNLVENSAIVATRNGVPAQLVA